MEDSEYRGLTISANLSRILFDYFQQNPIKQFFWKKVEAKYIHRAYSTIVTADSDLDFLEKDLGRSIPVQRGDWRPGDQKVYVSNILKAKQDFGWEPKVSVEEGVHRLYLWIKANKAIFQEVGIIK